MKNSTYTKINKKVYKYLTTNSEVDILDIGCGNGNFKKKFEELAEEEYHNKKVIYGEKCYAYGFDGEIMFEFKCYKNENVHLKLNIELAKAMNVEVARLLGWIKNKEDIKEEFNEEMSKGAEKYFKINNHLQLSDLNLMIGEQKDEN